MGADIHITVGRVSKQLAAPVQPETGTALAVFNNKRFAFGDFEFTSDIPDEVELYRHYGLFSFLAAVRGNLRPIIPQDALQKATLDFLKWLNTEHRKLNPPDYWTSYDEDFIGSYASYDVGDHSRVFYPIEVLRSFDYDQIALIEDERSNFNNPIYFPDEEGSTYRDWIKASNYFEFLDWCVSHNWHFVIFGFDN